MVNQLIHAEKQSLTDNAGDIASKLEAQREDARLMIIQHLLADDSVDFAFGDTWTFEEMLEQFLVVDSEKLDQFIRYQQEH